MILAVNGRFLISIALLVASCGCGNTRLPTLARNHSPVVHGLIAFPDTIGPSDSTVVVCSATDADGDTLVYDWETDARLDIAGEPTWNKYLNAQLSPRHTFYNADLSNPINDSAWVYCLVRDRRGGGADREVFIILERSPSPR